MQFYNHSPCSADSRSAAGETSSGIFKPPTRLAHERCEKDRINVVPKNLSLEILN